MTDMDKSIPDFAILQNSRTRESALWIKEVGKWKRCGSSDYQPILIMANLLRNSSDPSIALKHIAEVIVGLGDIKLSDEEGDRDR